MDDKCGSHYMEIGDFKTFQLKDFATNPQWIAGESMR